MLLDVLSFFFIGLAIGDWIATVILARAAYLTGYAALRERALSSIVLSSAATMVALLSVDQLIKGYDFPPLVGFIFLVGALAAISLPQFIWLLLYKLGKFSG